MESLVLLKFNKYYVLLSEHQQPPTLIHESSVAKIPHGRNVSASNLRNILNHDIKEQLFAYRAAKYVLLASSKDYDTSGFLGLGKPSIELLISKAETLIEKWNAERKDT